VIGSPPKISSREENIMNILASTFGYMLSTVAPKKGRLEPQNNAKSLGPEKL
jgi:hypothetical protein